MMNPMGLFKMKGLFDQLKQAHPRMIPFVQDVCSEAIGEGTLIDIRVTDPQGKVYHYNMRLTAEDMHAIEEVREAGREMTGEQQ